MVEIILDPSIRDWVVLPMMLIIGCSSSMRHYITQLLKTEKIAAIDELRPMYVWPLGLSREGREHGNCSRLG
jgi:hypothetical protein